jgi:hypothetical protein
MGGGAALAKPIKIAQSIGIIKKSTAPVAKSQPSYSNNCRSFAK